MRQCAAIARTLYERQPIVLMDEPFFRTGRHYPRRDPEPAAELLAQTPCC